jgi:NADPH:quinone reductase-like Zn-dependent oxidoreductase
MRAAVRARYGGPAVIELVDKDTPALDDDRILIRVRAAGLNAYDWHMMRGKPYLVRTMTGPLRPKDASMGVDLAGVVEAVGKNVTGFKPGDEVFGPCRGAFAEYVAARAKSFAHKPDRLSFEQAAGIPMAGTTALQALRDVGALQPGQRVLVHGAGGGVGTFAVQIAKALDARVTAVCGPSNVGIARSIGADRVIDYTREDALKLGDRYDLILSVAGNRAGRDFKRVLNPGGRVVLVGAPKGSWIGPLLGMFWPKVMARFGKTWLRSFLATNNAADLELLAELARAGTLTPVIDRTYPLAETADAMRYLGEKHARGKVTIVL